SELDRAETLALRRALGAAAEDVKIASVLRQTGEFMSSAGVRLLAALYALARQTLPGTLGCTDPDPAAALPRLCRTPQPAAARHVLIPTLSQGGGNAALLIGAPSR